MELPNFEIIFKQKIKYANILFSMSVFYLIVILIYNVNLSNIREQEEKLYIEYHKTLKKKIKIHYYENDRQRFISAYLLNYLQKDNSSFYNSEGIKELVDDLIKELFNSNKEWNLPEDIDHHFMFFDEKSHNHSHPEFSKLFKLILIISELNEKEKEDYIKICRETVEKLKFQKVVERDLLNSDNKTGLFEKLYNTLYNNDNSLYHYIETDELYLVSMSYYKYGNSYLDAYEFEVNSKLTFELINYHYNNLSFDDLRVLINNEHINNYNKLKSFFLKKKNNSATFFGIDLITNQILLFSGFILFFLLVLYHLYHNIERKSIKLNKLKQEFLFPNFGIANSPFKRRKKNINFTYIIINSIWTFFLILPSLVLTAGFLFRYNFHQKYGSKSYIEYFYYNKSPDTISIFSDFIHLIALIYSIWFIVDLSSIKRKLKIKFRHKILLLISLITTSVLVFFLRERFWDYNLNIYLNQFLYFIYLLSLLFFLFISITKKSRLGIIISIFFIFINVVLFFR